MIHTHPQCPIFLVNEKDGTPYGDLLSLMYPFAKSFSNWTLSSFNSSFIQYGTLARGVIFNSTLITWSTHLLRGNSSSITSMNSYNTYLTHLRGFTNLVASFGSNLSITCITHNMPQPPIDAPPHSLRDSNVNSKMKTTKEKIGVIILSSQHFKGKRGVLELWNGD